MPQAAAAPPPPAANAELADVDALVQSFAGVDMSDFNQDKIPCFPFHAPGVRVSGVGLERDDICNVMGVCALLGNGVDLGSLDFELKDNLRNFTVEARGVVEMQDAHAMLPAIIYHRNNKVWEPLRNALKTILIQREVDRDGKPIIRGSGKLPFKATSKYPLRLDKLNLWETKYDDNGDEAPIDHIMIHKVPIDRSREETTVPAYVAICFFQQEVDQGVKAKGSFFRRLPGISPRGPPSTRSSKRSRGGGPPSSIHTNLMSTGGGGGGGGGGQQGTQGQGMQVDTNPSPLSGTDHYMSPNANDPLANPLNQPSPDQYASGGFFNFGRTRRTSNH